MSVLVTFVLDGGRTVPGRLMPLGGDDEATALLASQNVVEVQDLQGTPIFRRNASGELVPVPTAGFSIEEEARIDGIVHSMKIHQESARRWRASLVGANRLQELNNVVKSIHNDRAVTRRICRVAGRASDLIDEMVELLAVHNVSPSVGGVVAPTVGESSTEQGKS